MAILSGQLTISRGISTDGAIKMQGFLALALSSFTNCNLISKSLIISPVGFPLSSYLIAIADRDFNQGFYHNYQSRFARFFGIGARQDASKLYIQKADLGLALTTNNAESILVALLLQVMKHESNSLISRVTVEVFNVEFLTDNNVGITRTILLVNLYSFVQTFESFEILITSVTPNNFN